MFFTILKKDLKRGRTMNTIIFLFITISVMFISGSVNSMIASTSSLDKYFEKAGVADLMCATYDKVETQTVEQVLEKALQKFLEAQKNQSPKIHRGKQTLKQLAGQNAGLANIEISDRNIKAFTHVAKKYHVDFALKKDTTTEQPRYLVFFKSRDADAITAAFQEFASRKMGREEKTSIRERLAQAREQAARKVEHRTLDREKVKVKERGVEL